MLELCGATLQGGSERANEDAFALTPTMAVVVDGATAPAEVHHAGCIHDPAWYANSLVTELVLAHVEDRAATPRELLATAIEAVAAAHGATCDAGHPGAPSATVSFVVADAHGRLHWLVLGDCTLVLDSPDGIRVITDDRISATSTREREAIHALDARHMPDERSRRIAALVTAQRQYKNRAGGFWVAASDPAAAAEALTGSVALEAFRGALLLTDGAARAFDHFGMTPAEALESVKRDGPASFLRYVRRMESGDPEGIRFPRIKCSDDATAVAVVPDRTLS